MAEMHQYRKGTLIGFESGEYSDFTFNGMLVALTDLHIPKLVLEYITERVAEARAGTLGEWEQANAPSGFMAWLVAKQYAAPIDYSELYLGAYGSFEDDLLTEVPTAWHGHLGVEDVTDTGDND